MALNGRLLDPKMIVPSRSLKRVLVCVCMYVCLHGFDNGRKHLWIVRSASHAPGFKRGMLVKNRAKNTTVLFGKINHLVSWTDD